MAEVRRRRREYWAGLGATVAVVLVLVFGVWPVPRGIEGPVFEVILRDPVIVGVLRMATVVAALYAIASVPALIVGGRWAKGVGTGGFVADEAHAPASVEEAGRTIATLRLVVGRLLRERDDLLSLVDAETKPD